ncbi:hypothetical protein [Mesorhizobium sp.]|uniref:hypothetical protein n=1 Tax=Mesorhizobium sp. TaxID=1871066 RepID=UPI000FE56D15|nr:hypothetical protein [Mesorhizobium sp.]RWE44248.1 MAG: hypothetical protein EOS80_20120 [Mesorhizobium sp.]
MAKEATLTGTEKLAAAVLAVAVVNYLSVRLSGFPFAYCWLSPVTTTLYRDWGLVILYGVSAYIVFQLFRRGMAQALGGTLIFIAIIELPRLADAVFRLGGSCG